MQKFALVTNYNIYDKAVAAVRVAETLADLGGTVLLPESGKDRIFRMHKSRREYVYLQPDLLYEEAEAVIVLGGDGSLLDAARHAAPLGKPLLGVNLGHLGYMTELELTDLDKLSRLFDGQFTLDRRAMLDIAVRTEQGGVKAESFALNDAVLSNGSVARIVDLELYVFFCTINCLFSFTHSI